MMVFLSFPVFHFALNFLTTLQTFGPNFSVEYLKKSIHPILCVFQVRALNTTWCTHHLRPSLLHQSEPCEEKKSFRPWPYASDGECREKFFVQLLLPWQIFLCLSITDKLTLFYSKFRNKSNKAEYQCNSEQILMQRILQLI